MKVKHIVSFFSAMLTTFCLDAQEMNPLDDGRKIRIPVVFHVIYGNEIENIDDRLILEELKDLNLDFSKRNDMTLLDQEFSHLVGNPNIDFYLLDTLFKEGRTNGIRHIVSSIAKMEDQLLIDPKNCLNVIISDHGNSSNILGDRVNLNYKDIGAHQRGFTHETGHWLGLYHIFGPIKNTSWWRVMFGNNDDEIADTPEQKGATAVCYKISEKCPCPPKDIDIYYKGHKTMYNNFMDYNPCRCMFSIGQSIKMRNNIISEKRSLFDKSIN